MNLYPCAYSMTFNVTDDRLNAVLNQRSQDILAANNWNVVQYAVLLHMIAQVSGLKAGELVHVIADAHIYDRHIPIIKELISGNRCRRRHSGSIRRLKISMILQRMMYGWIITRRDLRLKIFRLRCRRYQNEYYCSSG